MSAAQQVTFAGELDALAARFSSYGITPDLAELTLVEAWGLLMFLRRLAGAAAP